MAGTKFCNSCQTEKPVEDFYVRRNRKNGLDAKCKPCCKKRLAKVYADNKENILAKNKSWSKRNVEARRLLSRRCYRKNNPEKPKKPAKNPERYQKEKTKAQSDPLYASTLRYRQIVYKALKRKKEMTSSLALALLGANTSEVIAHIECKFKPGMSWDNHGKWHMDHIIPLSSANTETELVKLFHFKNMQPLWADEHLKKGAKIQEYVS